MSNNTEVNTTLVYLGDDYYKVDDAIPGIDRIHVIHLVMIVTSLISIISCCLVIYCFIKFRLWNKKEYLKIVFYMVVSDLIFSTGSVLGLVHDQTSQCYWQAFSTNMFPLATTFWSLALARILYYIVVYNKLVRVNLTVHIICWGLSILLTVLPLINSRYGTDSPSGGWCFFVESQNSLFWTVEFWEWFGFYGWLCAGIIILFTCYVVIVLFLRKRRVQVLHSATTPRIVDTIEDIVFRKLFMYPAILIVSWILR